MLYAAQAILFGKTRKQGWVGVCLVRATFALSIKPFDSMQKIVPKLGDGRLLRSEHLLGTLWYIISVPLLMVVLALFPIGK